MIECSSRFVDLFPMKISSTTAKEFTEKLVAFYGRYGRPREKFSDRGGTQFVNDLISEFCKISSVEWKTFKVYSNRQHQKRRKRREKATPTSQHTRKRQKK